MNYTDKGQLDTESITNMWASDYIPIADEYSIFMGALSYAQSYTYKDESNVEQTASIKSSWNLSVLYYDAEKQFIGYDYNVSIKKLAFDVDTKGVIYNSIRFVEEVDSDGNVIPYDYYYTPSTDKKLKPPGANTASNTKTATDAAYFRIRIGGGER